MLSELCEAMKTNTYVRSFSLVATKSGDPIANVRLAAVLVLFPYPVMHSWQGLSFWVTLGGAVPIMSYRAALRDPVPLPLWLTTLKFQPPLVASIPPVILIFMLSPSPQPRFLRAVSLLPFCLSSVTYETVPNPNTSPYHLGGS